MWVEIEGDMYAALGGADQRQGARLLNEFANIFYAALALAAGDKISQSTDDLSRPQGLRGRLFDGVFEQR